MNLNVGILDRTLRIFGGLAVLSLAFVGPQTPWAYVAIVPVVTGFLGHCPAYTLFGFDTCSPRRAHGGDAGTAA